MDGTTEAREAAERIRESVSILKVLAHYGYDVHADDDGHEQQFSCDLHGSGLDRKPSARAYPATNSWYCFGCSVTRDPIETVRAKEDLSFWQAVKLLERAFGLEPYQWTRKPVEDARTVVAAVLDMTRTFDQDVARVTTNLDTATRERSLPLEMLLVFWEALDKTVYMVHGPSRGSGTGEWPERRGKDALSSLNTKINAAVVAVVSGKTS